MIVPKKGHALIVIAGQGFWYAVKKIPVQKKAS
jgi:hypothetical protein